MEVQRIPKPWGYELIWAHTPCYAGKILSIKRGCQLSLQLHQYKEESMYLLSGSLEVELEGDDGRTICHQAHRGASFHVPPRRRHRLRALTPCRVLEVSTPELDDIVRFEDDYGRMGPNRPAPWIAIVVPAFNAEPFLAQTIESVLAQTIHHWELILVDDGSTDGTAAIAAAYADRDPRIRVVRQPNQGIAGARNRGLAETHAGSEFVIFLDHDDLWEPEALATLVQALQANPQAVAAAGLSRYVDHQSRPCAPGELEHWGRRRQGVAGKRLVSVPPNEPTTLGVLAYCNCIFTPGQLLIRHGVLQAAGPFDPAAAPCDDWDMWLRLSQYGDIAAIDQVILNWRYHNANTSNQKELMGRQTLFVRRKLLASPELSAEQRQIVRRATRFRGLWVTSAWMSSARESLAQRQLRQAGRQLVQALKHCVRSVRGVPTV